MKKNKFYLTWMAAVLLAMGGCSDNIENGGNESSNNNGGKSFLTVAISTPTNKTMTKADPTPDNPTGGENGDGSLDGTEVENKIYDVNIFLVARSTQGDISRADMDVDANMNETTAIAASAYTDKIEAPSGGDVENHINEATVTVNVPTLDAYYAVYAITNVGSQLTGITNLGELRDKLIELNASWIGDGETPSGCSRFVMSTHQMFDEDNSGNALPSSVRLTEENSNRDNSAKTTVYVERLAARIDLKISSNEQEVENPVKEDDKDMVTLDGYLVVNQFAHGSNLMKRVTQNLATPHSGEIPSKPYLYLGDEIWDTQMSQYNFVIDPFTTLKKSSEGTDWSKFTIGGEAINTVYNNHFYDSSTKEDGLNSKTFKDWTSTSEDIYTPIAYVLENTTDITNQKNGFSTGVIFRGTYTPASISTFDEGRGEITSGTYTKDDDFYLSQDGVVYDELIAVGVESFKASSTTEGSADVIKTLFGNGSWSEMSTKVDEVTFKGMVSKLSGKIGDAYKKFIEAKMSDVSFNYFNDNKSTFSWTAFVAQDNILNADFTDVDNVEALKETYDISYYKGGKCYYKFWIRHANNGDNEKMAVMEFAIVRNNVYRLSVGSVKRIGSPLPFTPGVDDPDTPDEGGELFIDVNIYVKDWTIRNNGDIVLQ